MYTNISAKNIAVFGLGVSGRAALRFCLLKGATTLVVGSGDSSNWNWEDLPKVKTLDQNGPKTAEILSKMDMIILSPGIPREHHSLVLANKANVPIVNEIELAFEYFPGKIIAVTGTNGKTTTVSLIAQSLTQFGKNVFLGGNYGLPFLDWVCNFLEKKEVPLDFAVIELSSFQLESLNKFKADLGLILNISPSHTERYENFESYKKAKLNLIKYSKSILHGGDGIAGESLPVKSSRDKYLKENCDVSLFSLVGDYNLDNLWFVAKSLEYFSYNLKKLDITKLVGEPYRLQKITDEIYNDGKSTNWQATISAVQALSFKKKLILIIGGKKRSDRDRPTEKQIKLLKSKVDEFYCFGESGIELKEIFSGIFLETIEEVVKQVNLNSCILFSPAYPSFDQFENYIERGKCFTILMESRLNEL